MTANFWLDNWSSLGPLLEITGPEGPRITGLPLSAVVNEAFVNGR